MGHRKQKLILIFLSAALILTVVLSALWGRYPIGLKELFGILASKFVPIEPFWSSTQASLLLNHRIPRILLACLVGCSLSGAGAAYQGVFQNPMAAPDLLGASSGAAFGAALAILLDLSGSLVVLCAFFCSILTVTAVLYLGNRSGTARSLGLILAGILLGSLVSSGTSFIKLIADPEDQLPAITYWLMGSLNGTEPNTVWFALIPMALGLVPLHLLRWRINVLTLGDDEAQTIGVNVKSLRVAVILCATLITAASVAVSGVIGWIGLVVPHMARKFVGNDYRTLMPVSMLLGALLLLVVDDFSRTLFATEIPLGILTSLLGIPFFIMLAKEAR